MSLVSQNIHQEQQLHLTIAYLVHGKHTVRVQ